MARREELRHPQCLLFIALIVTLIMCVIGSVVPYWIAVKINARDVQSSAILDFSFIDQSALDSHDVITLDVGIWWFCVGTVSSYYHCERIDVMFKSARNDFWTHFIQAAVITNVLVVFLCMVFACCRSCCCRCGQTLFSGIAVCCSGIAGLVATAVVVFKMKAMLALVAIDITANWALYVFAVDSSLMIIISILLRFTPKWDS